MKNFKKLIAAASILGMLGAAGTAYAAGIKTPADIAASLTGKTVTELNLERASGKTYGTIAQEAGKLDEFKAQMLEQKKAILDQRVADNQLTQSQADTIYNSIKNNQALCDGTGSAQIGRTYGLGLGMGNGMGLGAGQGRGRGQGMGRGAGLRDGSCRY